MAVSPYLIFARKLGKSASLPKDFIARGKALGKLFRALPAAEKAAIISTAKATPSFKRTKVQKSAKDKALGVPSGVVKAAWFKTEGNSTKAKLVAIAKAKDIKIRKVEVVKASTPISCPKPTPSIRSMSTLAATEKSFFAECWRSKHIASVLPVPTGSVLDWRSRMRDVLSARIMARFERSDPLLDVELIDWPPQNCPDNYRLLCAADVDKAKLVIEQHEQQQHEQQRLAGQGITTLGQLWDLRDSVGASALPFVRMVEHFTEYFDRLLNCPVLKKPLPIGLTAHTTKFVGTDRVTVKGAIIKQITSFGETKEQNPIYLITGAPRMGKSRLLDEVARGLEATHGPKAKTGAPVVVSLAISLNSKTPLDFYSNYTLAQARVELMGRAIFEIARRYLDCGGRKLADVIGKIPEHFTWVDVINFAKDVLVRANVLTVGQNFHLVLLIDELSKLYDCSKEMDTKKEIDSFLFEGIHESGSVVVSGFTTKFSRILKSTSGRPVVEFFLGPVTAAFRDSYADLRNRCRAVCSPHLFHAIRFSPGLMGFALEFPERAKEGKLDVPVLGTVLNDWLYLSSMYWRHAANAKRLEAMGSPATSDVAVVEKAGVVWHTNGGRVLLNPFFDRAYYADKDHPLWPAYTAWCDVSRTRGPDVNTKRGKVLEAIVAWCMVLRTCFHERTALNVGEFMLLVAGSPDADLSSPEHQRFDKYSLSFFAEGHEGGLTDTEREESTHTDQKSTSNTGLVDMAILKAAAKRSLSDVVSFPCHSESNSGGTSRTGWDIANNKALGLQFARGEQGAVAQLSAKFNKGCDVVTVGDMLDASGAKAGRCCIMFETRFWEHRDICSRPTIFKHGVEQKLGACLLGIMANYAGEFKRIAFVYLTADGLSQGRLSPDFRIDTGALGSERLAVNNRLSADKKSSLSSEPTIRELLTALEALEPKCAFTTHCVQTTETRNPPDAFQTLTLGTFAYVCPDFELKVETK